MRRLIVAVLLGAAAPSAAAQGDRAAEIAGALERDPVYVAPAREERLGVAEQGRLRLRIVDRDIGRIKIAVVPASWAVGAGGTRAFANAIDAELGVPGALLVVADGGAHVVTSHEHPADAAAAVQRAFDRGGRLEDQLRRAVDGLAEVDPGPEGDVRPPAGGGGQPEIDVKLPDFEQIGETVDTGIKAVFFVVLAVVVGVFALVAFVFLRRFRQAREEDEDVREDLLAAAEAERVALGEDIVDLDVATSMPSVAPEARRAYERALDAYERSELALQRADTARRLRAATDLIAAGRRDAAAARQATLGG